MLKTGFQLAFADGGTSRLVLPSISSPLLSLPIAHSLDVVGSAGTPAAQVFAPLERSDTINPGIRALKATFALPKLVKRVLASFLPAPDAGLLRALHPKSVREARALVVEREAWKRAWHERWREEGVDLVLCAPCAVPGLPEGGTGVAGLVAASYAFLFSIVRFVPFRPRPPGPRRACVRVCVCADGVRSRVARPPCGRAPRDDGVRDARRAARGLPRVRARAVRARRVRVLRRGGDARAAGRRAGRRAAV